MTLTSSKACMTTYNVLESMRKVGVNKISFSSSSAIYGEAEEMPTPETYGPVMPISLYGASKLGSETVITRTHDTFEDFNTLDTQFANIVGLRDSWCYFRLHPQIEERR